MMAQATAGKSVRTLRRVEIGEVVGNKCDKTITVQVEFTQPHSKYGKLLRHRRRLYAHDEKNEAKVRDVVEIAECRRYSKMKAWRLVRIVTKASE